MQRMISMDYKIEKKLFFVCNLIKIELKNSSHREIKFKTFMLLALFTFFKTIFWRKHLLLLSHFYEGKKAPRTFEIFFLYSLKLEKKMEKTNKSFVYFFFSSFMHKMRKKNDTCFTSKQPGEGDLWEEEKS